MFHNWSAFHQGVAREEILSKRRVNTMLSINANLGSTISSYSVTKLNTFFQCKHCYDCCILLQDTSSFWYTLNKNFCIPCGQISPLTSMDMVNKNIKFESKCPVGSHYCLGTSLLQEALRPFSRAWLADTGCTMRIWFRQKSTVNYCYLSHCRQHV